MATVLSTLKVVNAFRQNQFNSTQFRREKMARKLLEQLHLAKSLRDGEQFVLKRIKTVTDKVSGETQQIEVTKRVNQWWWTEGSKILLQLKYGTKVLELAKGKNSIECSSGDELIKTLELVRTSVNNGELDLALETASDGVRSRFKK
jgi:hypothetical protein